MGIAIVSSVRFAWLPAMEAATPAMLVVPVEPNMSAIPYTRKADENAPSMKYFMAASSEPFSGRAKPDRT